MGRLGFLQEENSNRTAINFAIFFTIDGWLAKLWPYEYKEIYQLYGLLLYLQVSCKELMCA
jgi:hypothetical protein